MTEEKIEIKKERWELMLCPFHDDHEPSLVYNDKFFTCFACGQRGSIDELDEAVCAKPMKRVFLFRPLYHTTWHFVAEEQANAILKEHNHLFDGLYHNRMEWALQIAWDESVRREGSADIPPMPFEALEDKALQRFGLLEALSSSSGLRIYAARTIFPKVVGFQVRERACRQGLGEGIGQEANAEKTVS